MPKQYDGLPAAANVEQAIALAQLLIRRDLERRLPAPADQLDKKDAQKYPRAA